MIDTATAETRILPLDVRDIDMTADGSTLSGYAAVFNRMSQDLGGFYEEIDPAAFNRTLANSPDIIASLNHDVGSLLGRTRSGTLQLAADDIGLRYSIDLNDTTPGRDTRAHVERGDIFGSSFTFSVTRSGADWRTDDDGRRIRRLTEVRLYELGPVVSPAYLDTSVAVRSLADYTPVLSDEEEKRAQEIEEEEARATRESTGASRRPLHFLLR